MASVGVGDAGTRVRLALVAASIAMGILGPIDVCKALRRAAGDPTARGPALARNQVEGDARGLSPFVGLAFSFPVSVPSAWLGPGAGGAAGVLACNVLPA